MRPVAWAALLAAPVMLGAAQPATDWTRRVTQTTAGAFVLGNPAARTRLVEYVSYTCNHCAAFTGESSQPLKARVASGSTAVEVRHAVRDPLDLGATLLVRCAGPARFFAAHERVFSAQAEWYERGARYAQANEAALTKAPGRERVRMLATAAGLPGLVGLSPAQAAACFADKAAEARVLAMTDEAWAKRKIPGTPYFLVNGAGQDNVTSWAALAPRLGS